MKFGTTCTRVDHSSFGTSVSETETPLCFDDGYDCSHAAPTDSSGFGAGAGYFGYSYFKNVAWFEGTCDNRKPVDCSARAAQNDCDKCQYTSCCAPVALCEDDPNCTAIADCIETCQNDLECAKRCLANGDRLASANFSAAIRCISESCTGACGL